jgi:hypothetical protein
MKTKKIEKKWNKFCYKVINKVIKERGRRKKREKEGRRYGCGKIKNKSGKRK